MSNALRIGYSEFVKVCHVDDPKNFGGFRVEANGLYVDLPDDGVMLTPEELAAVTWHPTGQYDKPALLLPCTLGQLRAFLPHAGMTGCIDEKAVDELLGEREQHHVGWYGATLDADMRWSLTSTRPREAAMLLCQFNPHDDTCDPLTTTNDETGPDDYKRLLRVFEDVEKVEPKHRTLRQWHAIARDKGLKYHSWIDEYAATRLAETLIDSGSAGGSPKGGAGETAIDESIVRIKRNALIAKYQREWPSIEDDLRHSNENGLRAAAKLLDKHGYWNETAVARWGTRSVRHSSPTTTSRPRPCSVNCSV